jgi:plastocyanin
LKLFRSVRLSWHQFVLVGVVLLSLALTGSAAAQTDGNAAGVIHYVQATGSLTFAPKGLSINAGDTVVWINTSPSSSGIPHTVTSKTGAWVSSPTLTPGQHFHVTFNTAGTFNYYCKFHGSLGMVGQIVVH